MSDDDLERFVDAQEGIYPQALSELRRGRKTSHWMWFVFPQMRGLGMSSTAHQYGIATLEEAQAYLAHPSLGVRLKECAEAILAINGKSAREILGTPDDLKLRSSMTLFDLAAPDEPIFAQVLEKYYGGQRDQKTIALVA